MFSHVVVQMGTIKVGTPFICGPYYGKVKSLLNDQSEAIKEAGPALPVELLGFSGLPNVGDELVEMESERAAKKLSDERQHEVLLRVFERCEDITTKLSESRFAARFADS